MAFDPKEALRAAGILGDPVAPALEEAFASLSEEETNLLITLNSRAPAVVPEVLAHMASAQWDAPEATQHGFEAAMLCACGLWSGSGNAQN
ncbi:hypothetical protein Sme01_11960 [Sphaerisporangium melleum]|uniref:Uncharacterized protein n=1 Tax=Sphaerisporangium melleum TaxID=321316 RepID=A0A917VRI8_9ACTN|nr:StsA-related sactipeptide RiPP [Sphaerisporangium melleum]GGL07176.1 hypothetical protein GCM10007964_56820 [Sphaerisporangium melleum]GII68720.1 hypothetical protein Sme01_11960 [Sphaerisporangium melleum]